MQTMTQNQTMNPTYKRATIQQRGPWLPSAATPGKVMEDSSKPAKSQELSRSVRFERQTPNACSVCVVGTFNDWKVGATPLNLLGGGKWARELSLAPGRYVYRFIVDGRCTFDRNATDYVANPLGGCNSVLEVSL